MKRFFVCFSLFLLQACAAYTPFGAFDTDSDFDKGITAFNAGNFTTARDYLTPAAENGNPDAQYILGLIYLNGLNGAVNPYDAEKWLEAAANQGHTPAQIQLAYLYKDARMPIYNPSQAYYWFAVISRALPDYQAEMNNLNWTLKGKKAPKIKSIKRRSGLDYNQLYPVR